MPLDPRISLGVQVPQFESPVNMLGQMYNLQNAARQNQLAQMQMAEYERARAEEEGVRNYLAGGADVNTEAGRRGLLQYGKTGLDVSGKLTEQQSKTTEMQSKQIDQLLKSVEMHGRIMGTATAENWPEVRAKLMGLPGAKPDHFPEMYPGDEAIKSEMLQSMSVKEQLERVKPNLVQTDLDGRKIWRDQNPNSRTFMKEFASDKMEPLPEDVFRQREKVARAGAQPSKYDTSFQEEVSKQDTELFKAAKAAPKAIKTATRVSELLGSKELITGAGANIRLQLAKWLDLGGATEKEKIANTEVLVSSLAEQTLKMFQSSGLGARGMDTPAEREFLQQASVGNISYDAASLKRLATLAQVAAQGTIDDWNVRAKDIPESALKGAGLSREAIRAETQTQSKGTVGAAPAGVDPNVWKYMTPEERNLWQK